MLHHMNLAKANKREEEKQKQQNSKENLQKEEAWNRKRTYPYPQ